MTNSKMIGKYFADSNGIIFIESIKNEEIYNYIECNIDDEGITETENYGYITPKELKYYEEI